MNRFFTLLFAASCLTAVGQNCSDVTACNYGSEEGCIYPEQGFNCAGECLTVGEDFSVSCQAIPWGYENFEFHIEVWADCPFNVTGNFILSTGASLWSLYENDCVIDGQYSAAFSGYEYLYECCNGVGVDVIFVPNPITLCAPQIVASVEVSCAYECGCTDEYACNYDPTAYTDDYSCEYYSCEGCLDETACNYDPSVLIANDDSCEYESCAGCLDEGACNWDPNATISGECFYESCAGCTDPMSCNFDQLATIEDGSCLPMGCMDAAACNFNSMAVCESTCDYTCCPGPGCCGEGTTWNWQTAECDVARPSDSNFDGCVQLNDLLDLLSAYGDCAAEESAWQCGDPLEYQGYDYETVSIGEQCWFAENGRFIPQMDSLNLVADYPNAAVCGYYGANLAEAMEHPNFIEYGALYNWYAIDQWDICPTGWSVASDENYKNLEATLGVPSAEIESFEDSRGYEVGAHLALKNNSGWVLPGTNSTGFQGLPGGYITGPQGALSCYGNGPGSIYGWCVLGCYDPEGDSQMVRLLTDVEGNGIPRFNIFGGYGTSYVAVRCIKD